MMAVEQDHQPNAQNRPVRIAMAPHMHSHQQEQQYPQQNQQQRPLRHALPPPEPEVNWRRDDGNQAPALCSAPVHPDDQSSGSPENSIPPEGLLQRAFRSARQSLSFSQKRKETTDGNAAHMEDNAPEEIPMATLDQNGDPAVPTKPATGKFELNCTNGHEAARSDEGSDVSLPRKGAPLERGAPPGSMQVAAAATAALAQGEALESTSSKEQHPNPTNALATPSSKRKELAKKKTKIQSEKSVNDTASLFQKIFADRDPGKRKIKTKSVHEIPMDMAADEDDSDFEDVTMDSNDEDPDMVMPEDAASEDEIKPEQQEEFNDEQGLMTALWKWKDNDPEVCCVCLGRSTEADNVFVYCDTLDCALCIHQACYGVKTLPSESEPWLCDRCKAPPEEVVSCVCCPSRDGAFRRLVPDDPSGGWVHVVCALWLPETTLGDPENVDRISVRDIPEKNWMMAYSLLETIEDSDMADPYFTYCKQHGSADGQTKLNGWAKWVKQRDAFTKKWQENQGRKRTQRLVELQQGGEADEDGGEGLIEYFEHSYSQFKQARELRIARERSELSRQYSIGYSLSNRIDKSRSRLQDISAKAQQAMQERVRIEAQTRNLLSSLLECANYLENVSPEQLQSPLSIDTTMAWYNSLPDTSRWKSNIQDIIETIDIDTLSNDNPFSHRGDGQTDSGLDDSEGGQRHGRSSKGIYAKLSKKGGKVSIGAGKNVKSKKVHPKPELNNKTQVPVVFTSSRGRLIKRDFTHPDEYFSSAYTGGDFSHSSQHPRQSSPMSTIKIPKPIVPCTVCHQLTLPEEKIALERSLHGVLAPATIKALNRMVTCSTCQRQFHPKCLEPPMARVPPRGYSWNCEDCDSSGESHGSSKELSPEHSTLHRHHQSHSSDLDEALMVLADTAVTVSASSTPYLPEPSHGSCSKAPSRNRKRLQGNIENDDAVEVSGPSMDGGTVIPPIGPDKENGVKRIKTEDVNRSKMIKPRAKSATTHNRSFTPILGGAKGKGNKPFGNNTGTPYLPEPPHGLRSEAAPRNSKRSHASIDYGDAVDGSDSSVGVDAVISSIDSGKESGIKRVKTEDLDKPKMTKSKARVSATQSRGYTPMFGTSKGKGTKQVSNNNDDDHRISGISNATGPAMPVTPIIRGNLRIYPSGPHISPSVSNALMREAETSATNVVYEAAKAKAVPKKTKSVNNAASAVKKEAATVTKKKTTLSSSATCVKGSDQYKKKSEPAAEPSKTKTATNAKAKTATKASGEAVPTAAKTTKDSKSQKAGSPASKDKSSIRRTSVPAVPEPTPPKPKEVIRYTVGEKTVEELTAREDCEIERRDNVKFRKLRGRTLTMPAPPQEVLNNGTHVVVSGEATGTTKPSA
ncbi:hypothetical protein BGX28_007771 [Mortierella sp. GBA30]|nr:hypothetical protein BGX28_007771 [Mortierella sp. GBA30]